MKPMAAALGDADMKNVAPYAGKQAKPGFAKNKDLASLGEKLYRGGATDRLIPACSGCHSPTVPASRPSIRALAGQHADYAERSLSPSAAAPAAQPGDDRRRGQAQRPRDQALSDRRRPALIAAAGGRRPGRPSALTAGHRRHRAWRALPAWPAPTGSRIPGPGLRQAIDLQQHRQRR
jgi:cytochrome c553